MKKILLILIIPLASMGQISFEEITHRYDCHLCPGSLVVTKNQLKDTIIDGNWGKVSSTYGIRKMNKEEYIVIETEDMSFGVLEEGIRIFLTSDQDFLKLLFSKYYDTNYDSLKLLENGEYENIFYLKDISYELEAGYINIKIDSIVIGSGSNKNSAERKISNGTRVEKYRIK